MFGLRLCEIVALAYNHDLEREAGISDHRDTLTFSMSDAVFLAIRDFLSAFKKLVPDRSALRRGDLETIRQIVSLFVFVSMLGPGVVVGAMAARENLDDGAVLDPITMQPFLGTARATHDELVRQAPPGRDPGLGAYHRAVTTSFIRRKAHWLSATVPSYTHHAYATGSRFCDLASAALDVSTHDFIRRSELDKPIQRGRRRDSLVLFYGLDIEETVILALRQILSRLMQPSAGSDDWRVAFGRTVHRILSHTAPSIAAKLEMTSCLKAEAATCKGLSNRATELARRFDDRDYDRPSGIGFDYALWFDRDRDAPFWDRLQKTRSCTRGSDQPSSLHQPLPSARRYPGGKGDAQHQ